MARPNRNNQDFLNQKHTSYFTAIYARLSIEDNGIDGDSIETQIYYLQKYIKEHKELELISTYCDNGMTGTNFERPGFQAMLHDIKNKKINCIVVKDLSRFGRNYMETGDYLENILPSYGVRFISVNDNYDSMEVTSNEALALSLKNIYHHIYAKDISRKICTLFDVKKKKGLYLGRFAPYGYKKSKSDPYQLEIEEETASVVREIFSLRIKGLGAMKIARWLNDQGVPSQSRRLYELGKLKGSNGEADALWSGSSVSAILENPIYRGCIVERKSEQSYYKGGKKRLIPKEEWNYIENTHEAIIDQSTFEHVQSMIETSKKCRKENQNGKREQTENKFKGLVTCGYCQGKMVRDSGYFTKDGKLIHYRFICRRKYMKQSVCSSPSILENDLISSLSESMRKQLIVLSNGKEIGVRYQKQLESQGKASDITRGLDHNRAAIKEFEVKIPELYEDYKRGLLSSSEYRYALLKYEKQKKDLEIKNMSLNEEQTKEKRLPDYEVWHNQLLQFNDHMTGTLWNHLIEKIVVCTHKLEIHYTFCQEYD
jgi:DNA invertase Pin-like site-specific DNA recombinase